MVHPALTYAYSALLIVGGIIGFAKTGSVVSAVAGCTTGLAIAGLEMGKSVGKPNEQYFDVVLAFISVGLAFMMFKRFQATGKFMPAGLVAIISAVMFLVFVASSIGSVSSAASGGINGLAQKSK